jgi:uncharacterized protein (DUF362 family)/NAD-dependent dihydropyrimidine dehydrogenase PreA subunit
MNRIVAVRKCEIYEFSKIFDHIADIYSICQGPDLMDKKVLVKPNILIDDLPSKCISTHPVFVEALIVFLQSKGATVFVGDSPAVHFKGFKPVKSGIYEVCKTTKAEWIDFTRNPTSLQLRSARVKIASIVKSVDLVISLPKLKNHELVYFTGAVKNTLGLLPAFTKTKQHALYQNRESFSRFLVDLNEAFTPHFFLMDGIQGMEGRGPGQGTPVNTGVIIGSSNPLALDIIATSIAGYRPSDIPTNHVALARGKWLKSDHDIKYDGPEIGSLVKKDFKRVRISTGSNIAAGFLRNRLPFLRKLERRPVFIHNNCTGCLDCINICPNDAIAMHPSLHNHVVLTDSKCIRCFCCSEVCNHYAVVIKRKPFGV